KQERYNRRAGFSHNNRWQTFADYAYAQDFIGPNFVGQDGATWGTVNSFSARPYRLQSFTQVNYNEEKSNNGSVELNFDNSRPLIGQVRITRAAAKASMRHGYVEGDMLSIDRGTLVTGPGGLMPADSIYCGPDQAVIGELGGCAADFSPGGIEDDQFRITYDASGKHPVFGGF